MTQPTPERASKRVPVFCPVSFWGDSLQDEAVCVNLSRGGMALAVSSALPEGSLLRLSALLPGHGYVVATVVVVWARTGHQDRIGVRFIHLAQDALRSLTEFIADSVAAQQPMTA